MSRFQALGLSISAFRPIIGDGYYYPRGILLDDGLHLRMSDYSHVLSAWLGLDNASITIQGSQDYIEWWIDRALGLHIEINDQTLDKPFEGFVNQYNAQIGTVSASGGPLMDVINRCTVTYSPIDPTASPPAKGPETETLAVDDDDSIERFGVIEGVISGGTATESDAEYLRDAVLEDKSFPEESEDIATGGGAVGSITLQILGYWAWIDRFIFNDATNSTVTTGTKIESALAADPNNLISPLYDWIDDPGLLVAAEERDNRMALSVIKACAARGGASYERWLFGIYQDQIARFEAIPSLPIYQHRIGGRDQIIESYGAEAEIWPWAVRAGQWTFLPDYLAGRSFPTQGLRRDPRFIFNEQVTYTWPWQVSISGLRAGKLDQILANYGMGGM